MSASSVEVLWTARYDYQPNWTLPEHDHPYFQMIYIICGEGSFSVDKQDYDIRAASLFLLKPGCPHSLSPSSSVKTLDVKFLVRDRRLYKLLLQAPILLENTENTIVDLFERMRREGERGGAYYRELCDAFLTEIILLFLRNSTVDPAPCISVTADQKVSGDWVVQQVVRFIHEHYAEDCDMSKIAQVVRRSDRHVRQHFKDAVGLSPHQYLLQYRIEKAKELIERSNYSFKEIADRIGFKTVHHFARAFHDLCGETPGAWRRKYQDGICKDVTINPRFVNMILTVQSQSIH